MESTIQGRDLKRSKRRARTTILIGVLLIGVFFASISNPSRLAFSASADSMPDVLPIAGKWHGGEQARVGIYDRNNGMFTLKHANISEGWLTQLPMPTTDNHAAPLAGDWDGDGVFTPGLYEPSTGLFRLLNSNDPPLRETRLTFPLQIERGLPVAGDWDGDGRFGVGVYYPRAGKFHLRNTMSSDAPEIVFSFGAATDGVQPVAGDWDGDGVWTVGLFDPAVSVFHRAAANRDLAEAQVVPFGEGGKGWLPLSGAWEGERASGVGLFDPVRSAFHLYQRSEQEYVDLKFVFGNAGSDWLPLAGDWDGDGAFGVGLFAPENGLVHLEQQVSGLAGRADESFVFGNMRAWQAIAGDWDGDKNWSVGLFDPTASRFYLRNALTNGQEDAAPYCNFQQEGRIALAGDWDGSGQTGIGHFFTSNSTFNLCTDFGNVRPTHDYVFGVAGTGWLPIMGDWDGDGRVTAGLYDPALSRFHLTDEHKPDPRESATFVFGRGGAGWLPIAGDWNKSGRWSVGLYDREKGEFHIRMIQPRTMVANTFALYPAVQDNPNLRWFGYYNVDGFYQRDGFSGTNYVTEVSRLGYLNVGHIFPPMEANVSQQMIDSLDALRAAKMQAVINVQRIFVNYERYRSATPNANWRELLALYQRIFGFYEDTILGYYFDEPIELGINRDDIRTFTKALREAFPKQRVMIVESASQITNGNLTPEYVEFVTDLGIDLYYTDPVYGATQGQYIAGFKRLVSSFDKRIWIVGEGYTRFGTRTGNLIDAFDVYYSLAHATPQVTGMLVFLYPDDDKVNFPVTLRTLLDPTNTAYSPTLRALHERIGKRIIGK